MEREHLLSESLLSIRHLLSHLQGEVAALETSWSQVLLVLDKLEDACKVDELSGLYRRGAFFDAWSRMQAGGHETGVILIDLDHFKSVNDTYGHACGDAVIRAVGEVLGRFQSPGWCVAGRLGGEEFAIAFRGTREELLGTAELIRRLISRLEFSCSTTASRWTCTASLGLALHAESVSLAETLNVADQALYRAKGGGRDQVVAA